MPLMLFLGVYWALGVFLPCVIIGVFTKPIWGLLFFPLMLILGERGYRLLKRFIENRRKENDRA